MATTWTFASARHLTFGRDSVRHLGPIVRRLGVRKVFLISDPNLVAAGIVGRACEPLSAADVAVEVFDGGEPEPSLAMVRRCCDAARAFGPEGLIAVGGGSNIDAAKLTAAVLSHGGTPRDFIGEDRVPGPVLPLVCVPTTAGTGSEVSHAAVFTDTENRIKVSTLSEFLRPAAAVVDPALTITCPPRVTADSGIDALTHAVEAYTATAHADLDPSVKAYAGKNPAADLFAAEAIRLVGRFLVRAVEDGSDAEAREGMALAATLAGVAFSNAGVALVHAMEYPVGGAVHCSHGGGNGLLLPHVMRFVMPTRGRELADIAGWLGEDVAGLDPTEAALLAVDAVDRLREAIGVPKSLAAFGVTEAMLPDFADKCFALKRLLHLTPRPVGREDLLELYAGAL